MAATRAGSWSTASRAAGGRPGSPAASIAPWRSLPSAEAGSTSASTFSQSTRPSSNISSTSTPAGIFSPALCSHVAIGSDQAWISKVQGPVTSGVTHAS